MFRVILCGVTLLLGVVVFAKVRSRRLRQAVLLAGSYGLYVTWGAWFAAVLFTSTVVNFLLGRWLRQKPSSLVLWTGILFNLALLGSFKYLPGIALARPLSSLGRFAHLALPLGISFWTFQAMSYLFDLYRGEDLDPSFVEFALYMVFFPVAISGPICRLPEMLPQFRSEDPVRGERYRTWTQPHRHGSADDAVGPTAGAGNSRGGDGINAGFDHLTHWSGADVWCLAFGYGLQLFFDFAGYSHIAIGAAKMLGFTLPENFARPFQSTTPSIFWTRWHMSLSFWIRDYVFLPLATLRREIWWRNLALVVSMVLFGLWHKATLLFLLWGCYNGALLVLHRQVQKWQRRFDWAPPAFWTPISWITTMSLISLGWILFRAGSLSKAGQMLSAVFSPTSYLSHFVGVSLYLLVFALAAGYAVVLWVIEILGPYSDQPSTWTAEPRSEIIALVARKRWFLIAPFYALTLLVVVLIVTLTHSGGKGAFMYRIF